MKLSNSTYWMTKKAFVRFQLTAHWSSVSSSSHYTTEWVWVRETERRSAFSLSLTSWIQIYLNKKSNKNRKTQLFLSVVGWRILLLKILTTIDYKKRYVWREMTSQKPIVLFGGIKLQKILAKTFHNFQRLSLRVFSHCGGNGKD